MRKHLIAANWKMYKTPRESLAFLEAFLPMIDSLQTTGKGAGSAGALSCDIALFPSITSVPTVITAAAESSIAVGAQTMHWKEEGAYTGETSPLMLVAIGVTHVLIGHSERRQYFNETDETVNLKLKSALAHGLVPVICVGEDLNERQDGHTEQVLGRQVAAALQDVSPEEADGLIFAYEPIWAIGTGKTATPELAEANHKLIRSKIHEILGAEIAEATRILYGGSVKPDNASSLCCMKDIDGALIGGASLDPESLFQIIQRSAPRS